MVSITSARSWQVPPGLKQVRVNDYDIAYQDSGSGPPLVLVHGSFSDYRYFTASIDTLAQEHRVIALSLRHYYPERWDGQGSTFSLSQHASDVAALVQVLGLGRVHLLGHSRGGTVALYVAKRHPELLRSLILAEGGVALRAEPAPLV